MNSRRSKRKVVQEQISEAKTKRQKQTQRKEDDDESGQNSAVKESRDRRRKSGRRVQKIVSYNENGNTSSEEDQSESRDDPEFMAEEVWEDTKKKGNGRRNVKVRQEEKYIKTEPVVSKSEGLVANGPFEVTLKSELNLSSDEDSDHEDKDMKQNVESEKHLKTSANKIHVPYFPAKKENGGRKEVKESLKEKVVSKKPVRKLSLFDDSEEEEEEKKKEEDENQGMKEEELEEKREERPKKKKKAVVKLKKITEKAKEQLHEEVKEEEGSDSDYELKKRPKRKSRIDIPKTTKKEEGASSEDDKKDEAVSKQVTKRRINRSKRGVAIQKNENKETLIERQAAETKEVTKRTNGRKKRGRTKVSNETEVMKNEDGEEKQETKKRGRTKVSDETEVMKNEEGEKKQETSLKEEASDSSDEEWEDVEDIVHAEGSPKKKKQVSESSTSKGLEIDIELPGQEKKKKSYDWATYFRRQLNRFNKERQIELHKVHLLCLLANGFHRNQVCNNELLQGVALSVIPLDVVKARPKKLNIDFVYKLLFWFRKNFEVDASLPVPFKFPVYKLLQGMQSGKFSCDEELVMVFVLCIRALGGDARLVMSFQPMTWKAEKLDLNPKGKKSTSSSPMSPTTPSPKTVSKESDNKSSGAKPLPKDKTSASKNSHKGKSHSSKNPSKGKTPASKNPPKRSTSTSKRALNDSTKQSEKTKKPGKSKSVIKEETENGSDEEDIAETPKRTLRKRKATTAKIKRRPNPLDDVSDEEDGYSSEGSNYSEEEWIHQKKTSTKKKRKGNTVSPNTTTLDESLSSDSDFEIETLSVKKPKQTVRKLKKNYKILSSDSDQSVEIVNEKPAKKKTKKGVDVWAEVFVAVENTWVSVDCVQGFVNKPFECETQATQPLLYVVGFDNENSAKDITPRYASRWMAFNIKIRIEKFEENWWKETLSSYKSKKKKRDKDEDRQMQAHNLDQPLPKSIVEYKNHPLYALKRHLLKFEAIYPETAAVLGYCRGEPVYSRECVHILKSKHTWMKEARVVKDGEKPYKFVKKLINPFKKHLMTPEEQNQMLDIYGEWQTEPYVPPPAKDGIVPRNEYGNVELFQPSMLPKGTVHLKIPGLNKVANKLDIDCAPAMMGWEFHKRFACPILDGFVVCEEVADVLVAAWEEEQVELEKKRKLKREQRAMKNWKHLIKSMLIREKLKEKYQLEDDEPEETKGKSKGKSKKKKTAATKDFWPQNKMTTFEGDASNLLPFEKKSAKT
ncbi:DNA repair protein complementing XP-C cells-like [Holothuria leucospilota]|uniref:DNA repair protein complementing XP-C cells-like n=1 Tax=Holothuria leucospilota TaxID=206669 RepID=A0A9Q1HIS1_HOLLE|nr:DNA repair protein complementing XP-C cells-like [Holothuria leucospilota]